MPSPIRTTLALLSFTITACGTQPASLTGPQIVITPQGLEQSVRLSPAVPAPGETLDITSVVVNKTTSAVDVTSRICGLDLESSLALVNSTVHCAGYSAQGELAAGDSVLGFERRTVAGKAGDYTLRIRHLLDPAVWIEVPVTVR
jgi:hypothetical protein